MFHPFQAEHPCPHIHHPCIPVPSSPSVTVFGPFHPCIPPSPTSLSLSLPPQFTQPLALFVPPTCILPGGELGVPPPPGGWLAECPRYSLPRGTESTARDGSAMARNCVSLRSLADSERCLRWRRAQVAEDRGGSGCWREGGGALREERDPETHGEPKAGAM